MRPLKLELCCCVQHSIVSRQDQQQTSKEDKGHKQTRKINSSLRSSKTNGAGHICAKRLEHATEGGVPRQNVRWRQIIGARLCPQVSPAVNVKVEPLIGGVPSRMLTWLSVPMPIATPSRTRNVRFTVAARLL